jgi:hypothetical protein
MRSKPHKKGICHRRSLFAQVQCELAAFAAAFAAVLTAFAVLAIVVLVAAVLLVLVVVIVVALVAVVFGHDELLGLVALKALTLRQAASIHDCFQESCL